MKYRLRNFPKGITVPILMGMLPCMPTPVRSAALSAPLAAVAPMASVPTIALLDPVDVATGKVVPGYGDFLREGFRLAGRFHPLARDEMEKKLGEFDWRPTKACHEFQCGFDAGNILLAEYVFFGTLTALDGIYAYTFNILHVPTGQVIHSEAGDVARGRNDGGDEPLKAKLEAYVSGLDPARLDVVKRPSRGLMAVVDLSSESPESRVMAERVGTHVYASRQYDLMSQLELQELLSAMGIPLSAFGAADSGMIALGARLNVAYLVQSRLSEDSRGRRLDLALFDVAGKRRVRDWPSKPTRDFQSLLHLENRFFTTLTAQPEALADRKGGKAGTGRSRWKRNLLAAAGVSAAAGLSALAYSMHMDANSAYRRAEAAQSAESGSEWRREVRKRDKGTMTYGALAATSLGLSVALWTF
jgi:hypothetical protein